MAHLENSEIINSINGTLKVFYHYEMTQRNETRFYNAIQPKFVKKTSMPDSVKSL